MPVPQRPQLPRVLALLAVLGAAAACQFGDNASRGVDHGVDHAADDDDDDPLRPEVDAGPLDPVCGDGDRVEGEECDDGNAAAGDGCSAICELEATPVDCALVEQSGCPDGEACDFDGDGDTYCRPAGDGERRDLCDALTDCAAGFSCLSYGDDSACFRFCDSEQECGTSPGAACETVVEGGDATVRLCTLDCDPPSGSGCPLGWACDLDQRGDKSWTTCLPHTGGGGAGAACDSTLECRDGFACAVTTAAGDTTCRAYCVLGELGCAGDASCTGFVDPIVIGGHEYGICL